MAARGQSRLIVVSNRVGPVSDSARAGGLAVALVDALRARGGVWFGWSGNRSEHGLTNPVMRYHGRLSLATLPLSEDDYDEFYRGFANSSLWPLFHYRIDLATFDRQQFNGYMRVNHRFARTLTGLLRKDDTVWVHDYHFLPMAEELRRIGCAHRIGFFLHTPFPAPEVLITLPVHDRLVRAMFGYDLIGFQTEADRRCFARYVVDEAGGTDHGDGTLSAFGRTLTARAFPISIDTDAFARMAREKEAQTHLARMRTLLQGRAQVVGVDRLDYSKGLPQRVLAFRQLLASYPENRGAASFLQIAPRSRADVSQYRDIRAELEGLAGSINGEFGNYDWTPIRYLGRAFSRRALAGIYRASRVGLVTPLRDGMNLVAKEYVAAQSARNPGVLVLSRFAGAAAQLHEALIVNPYDVQGVADALQRALNMPLEERRERWQAMIKGLRTHDVAAWTESFLDTLGQAESAAAAPQAMNETALLGDVGGTNARFALASRGRIGKAVTLATGDFADLNGALAHALQALGGSSLQAVALCAAGPPRDGTIALTNGPWDVSVSALRDATGVERPLLVNDFTALAASLPGLPPRGLRALGGGAPEPGAALAVLGPGTGLGVSGLLPGAHGEAILSGEGGHVDLAASNAEEDRILARLRERFGHVSAERVLSGAGLEALYAAMHPGHARDAVPRAPAIAARAAEGDPHALACVRQFCAWLGAVAADLVLTLGARGGLYLGGGIVPAWGELFQDAVFRQRFEDKGRYRQYLHAIPAYIITTPQPALIGLQRLLGQQRRT